MEVSKWKDVQYHVSLGNFKLKQCDDTAHLLKWTKSKMNTNTYNTRAGEDMEEQKLIHYCCGWKMVEPLRGYTTVKQLIHGFLKKQYIDSNSIRASLVAQLVKNPPPMQETPVQFLGQEDPLEEGLANDSSILACRIPMERGAWRATVHGVAESWTWLNDSAQHTVYWYNKILFGNKKEWRTNACQNMDEPQKH